MFFNDKAKKIVCTVLAVALGLPLVVTIISMFAI